jgi:hypothetical protein
MFSATKEAPSPCSWWPTPMYLSRTRFNLDPLRPTSFRPYLQGFSQVVRLRTLIAPFARLRVDLPPLLATARASWLHVWLGHLASGGRTRGRLRLLSQPELLKFAPAIADALPQLRHRGRHGDPTHDRYHRSYYGDEAGDRSDNFGWTGPQSPIQLSPSTVDKHHSEFLPPVLPQMTTSSRPQELFRHDSCFLVSAPHQTGARNNTQTRLRPDSTNNIAAGTSRDGKAARTATTRANPHHLARLFLLLDMAHLGRADAPRCAQSKSILLALVKGKQEILLPI